MSAIINNLPLPEIYFDHHGKSYWLQDDRAKWIKFNEESVRRYLVSRGYSAKKNEDGLSPADQTLLRLQLGNNVDYSGGLAGRSAGFHEYNGTRMLITESPRLVVPREGPWPLLNQILNGMFGTEQLPYLYGWLKQAMRAYREQRWAPGQALALAGPVESGKSLFQSLLTELLGGREADAHNYMIGDTNFNLEMFRAEHLTLNDKCESTSIATRRQLGAKIKEIAANEAQYCHGKNLDARALNPIWRLSISLNDDPERIMILPPMDNDIADKVMLFRVTRCAMPMPTSSPEDKELFRAALSAELPAFAHFIEHYQVPEELRSTRYGVRHYHHPELLEALDETAPEFRLLELIDTEHFQRNGPGCAELVAWDATSAEIERQLTGQHSSVRREAEKLFPHARACGAYLGRLAARYPGRIARRTVNGHTRWTIQPPPDQGGQGVI